MAKSSVKEFLKRKNVNITVQTYLIDAWEPWPSACLLPFSSAPSSVPWASSSRLKFSMSLPTMPKALPAQPGIAIAHALKRLSLFCFPLPRWASRAMPWEVLWAPGRTIVAAELGKIVSKETRLDIIVTPGITIISGVLVAQFVGPGVAGFMNWFGNLVKTATEMQPFIMGILVSALIGIALTLPISSAAICIALSLDGLAGGAATAGCCAQMIGFAVMSYRENKIGGLMAQGLGTSMLQMGNIVLNPRIWIPPTLASMITGPIATMVFRLENIPAGSGMGTCGLVGPIGVYTAMGGGTSMWMGILLVCFLLPAVLTFVFGEVLRRMGWIKDGDLKLDL